jgi:hypothetical protein
LAADARVVVFNLKPAGVDADTTLLVSDLVATSAGKVDGVEALGASELQRLANVEAERQKLGCDMDQSCLSEIASAMQARYTIDGKLGKLGSTYVVNLSLTDTQEVRVAERVTIKAAQLDELADLLDERIAELLRGVAAPTSSGMAPSTKAEATPDKPKLRSSDDDAQETGEETEGPTTTQTLATSNGEATVPHEPETPDAKTEGANMFGTSSTSDEQAELAAARVVWGGAFLVGGLVVGGLGLWGYLSSEPDSPLGVPLLVVTGLGGAAVLGGGVNLLVGLSE